MYLPKQEGNPACKIGYYKRVIERETSNRKCFLILQYNYHKKIIFISFDKFF